MNQDDPMYSDFSGFKEVTVDGKGRVVIPKIFHESILGESGSTLSVSMDVSQQCIVIVTKSRWEKQREALTSDTSVNLHVKRLKLGTHEWVDMDATGRILIPKALRTMAQIEREGLISGVGTRLELWDMNLFTTYYATVRAQSNTQENTDSEKRMSASETIETLDL